jgi:lipid-binding SYLF domain-containing protein
MRNFLMRSLALVLLALPAWAADCDDAVKLFLNAGQSAEFFSSSYGYAVFPTIGKVGVGIGGAHGKGCVYVKGQVVGEATMNQLTAGAQVGGQAYSQIVFFQDERSFKEFTNGNFEFGAEASAIAITAAAGIKGNTGGSSASASGGKNDAKTAGKYNKGMAIFTVAKGGLMYEASVGGQKFKYTAKK